MYRSQADAQELAQEWETNPLNYEMFHQAYPPLPNGVSLNGLWE
jgi:hypothetical protein